MPDYAEAAEELHKKGKLIGCHFDGNNEPIMELIAKTPLDYIEAYDPLISPPMETALRYFSGKVIWINWPSGWHLSNREEAAAKTRGLLQEVKGAPGFIIGVTEDIPPDNVFTILQGIADGIGGGA
jgi:hypothetical protein